jgi:large subunit ribosomal protein L4
MASPKASVFGGAESADLPGSVFAEPFHESLVHEAVRADLAARRRGSASTLRRGEVAMTTAKAWRQKGTGRARVGALSAAHRRGGGVTFGPKPRRYTVKVNRKANRRALRAALSVHADRDSIAVLDGAAYSEPSTKTAAAGLAAWKRRTPILIVAAADEENIERSFRNIPDVAVTRADSVGVADVIGAAALVVSQSALPILEQRTAAPVKRSIGGD